MTLLEMYYVVWRKEGKDEAENIYRETKMLPIEIVDVNETILLHAGSIKANYSLSVADAFIIATALTKKGILVHKDPEFEQVSMAVQFITLPYK